MELESTLETTQLEVQKVYVLAAENAMFCTEAIPLCDSFERLGRETKKAVMLTQDIQDVT